MELSSCGQEGSDRNQFVAAVVEKGMSDEGLNGPPGVLLKDMKSTLNAGMPLEMAVEGHDNANDKARETPFQTTAHDNANDKARETPFQTTAHDNANDKARETPFQTTAASKRRRLSSTHTIVARVPNGHLVPTPSSRRCSQSKISASIDVSVFRQDRNYS